jgi:hypothetical protein
VHTCALQRISKPVSSWASRYLAQTRSTQAVEDEGRVRSQPLSLLANLLHRATFGVKEVPPEALPRRATTVCQDKCLPAAPTATRRETRSANSLSYRTDGMAPFVSTS